MEKIKIPKKVLAQWAKEYKLSGPVAIAGEAGVNFRTLTSAIKTGTAKQYVMDTVNAAIIRIRFRRESIENKITGEGEE